MLASEAEAAGYTVTKPAPPATVCRFCGRTLEHMGMISPFDPDMILMWSPNPQRCDCDRAIEFWQKHDREEADRKAAEDKRREDDAMQARISGLIRDSGMRGRFQNRTFERWVQNEQNSRAFGICRRYANAFQMMLPGKGPGGRLIPPGKERNGLFLVGGYGTGKTHLAAAIANQLIQAGTPVICMAMIDLLARIKETFDKSVGPNEAEIMRVYQTAPLLIIDDLGSEQPTEWGATTIFSIVNARYEAYMPTIVTTNCGVDELVQRMTPRDSSDRNAQKTVDRLRETCVAVHMDWPSWRASQ